MRWKWLAGAGLLFLVWTAAGLKRLDPAREFGVVDGPGRLTWVANGALVLAPPGLFDVRVYPLEGVELPLPGAAAVRLPAPDGSRFGFNGWVTLRARREAWRAIDAAARGSGLEGVLLEAARAAGGSLAPQRSRRTVTPAEFDHLERELGAALSARGLDLRGLRLDSFDFLTVATEELPAAASTRLLVIGLDGADWAILDDLLAQGRMPHLAALLESGTRAKLLSINPMLSPVVWTSAATGVEPTRHGIHDFLVEGAQGGPRQPVTSVQRLVPTVWEMLSRAEVDVSVTGWWATWPADPVRGLLVSDRVAYQLFGFKADPDDSRGKTWPPELYDQIRPLIVEPSSIGWDRVRPYLVGERTEPGQFDAAERQRLEEFRTVLASGETYLGIADALRRRRASRLEVVYFEGTDTVGHLFMPYRPPLLPGIAPDRAEAFSAIVDRYYETVDGYLGRLLEGRDAGWTVMVLSDHGFAADQTRPRTSDSRIGHGPAADWHRRFGILVLSGAGARKGPPLAEATIYDIAPTILALFGQPVPRSWPGSVLGQALAPAFLEAHPVQYREDEMERSPRATWAALDPGAADLLAKLESLGYVAGDPRADSFTARSNVGVSLMAEGRFEEAEREFRAAIEQGGAAPMLLVNLALSLRFQNRLDEAAGLFARALDAPIALRIAGNQLAQLRLESGHLDDAERLVRRVLAAEPGAAEVHNTFGLILEQRGDLAGAEGEYRQASSLDPNLGIAPNNLGNLKQRAGDLDQAEIWYQRAIEADPYFIGAYNNLAMVYQARGQTSRAIDLYDRALGKDPDHAFVLNNLASLYFAAGETERAGHLWERAVQADPHYPSPLNNLASLKITEGDRPAARALLNRALALDPGYGDARINLAILCQQEGDPAGARSELERAATDPRAAAAAFSRLGLLELQLGRVLEAAAALTTAVERAPRNIEALNGLGEAYRRQGRSGDAIRVWERSLALDPRQDRLRRSLTDLQGRGAERASPS